jgi:two-component system nitrogen regulation response regulator NtrX
VQHFAKRTSEEHNLKPKRFEPRAMEALQRYRWRGNIRELRNTVERLMIMTPAMRSASRICPPTIAMRRRLWRGHLAPFRTSRREQCRELGAEDRTGSRPGVGYASRVQGTLRRRAISSRSCARTTGTSRRTAEIIDTPRSNLYKKLEQYGIKQEVDG